MKNNIIKIVISSLLLILAITFIWFVNKITTPHILESDLLNQCKNAGGEYNVFTDYDDVTNLNVTCKMPEKYLFKMYNLK